MSTKNLEIDTIKPTKNLNRVSFSQMDRYADIITRSELSKKSYWLSPMGIDYLKDWAKDNNHDLYVEIERNIDDDVEDNEKVLISKIKPSYKVNIFDANRFYYNVFGKNDFDELCWWGQIPKNIGDKLLYLNEELDLDVRNFAKPSIYRHNINFFEYTYLGEEVAKFIEECKDLSDILFYRREFGNFKEFSSKADKIQLIVRGYNDNLVSVGIGLYYNDYPYRWYEKIIHHEELLTVTSLLGITLPNDDTNDIKVERM